MKKILIAIIIILSTTGCNYTELNDLAIASSIGVDYEKDNFILTAQILDVKNSDSGLAEEGAIIYQTKGKTIADAVNNFYTRYPKNIYFGHIELIVISESVINKTVDNVFDYFIRSPETRTAGYITITKDKKAYEILNPSNENEDTFPTEDIKSVLTDATKRNGSINEITLEDLLSTYLKPGITPIAPLINAKSKGITSTSTIFEGLVPIEKNKVLDKLTEKQSKAYNTIFNNFNDTNINPKYKNSYVGIMIFNPKSTIKVKLKNNKVYVTININVESKVTEIDKKEDLTDQKTHNEIKKQVSRELYKNTYSLINYCKKNNTDLLGIGNEIYKNYFKEYDKYKDKNLYEISNIKIKVSNKYYRNGNIKKGAL